MTAMYAQLYCGGGCPTSEFRQRCLEHILFCMNSQSYLVYVHEAYFKSTGR